MPLRKTRTTARHGIGYWPPNRITTPAEMRALSCFAGEPVTLANPFSPALTPITLAFMRPLPRRIWAIGIARLDSISTTATKASGTEPVSSMEFTKVVVKDVPFQTIVEADTNPVPLTVSVTPVEPGVMLTSDTISTSGTGLLAASTAGIKGELNAIKAREKRERHFKQRASVERVREGSITA